MKKPFKSIYDNIDQSDHVDVCGHLLVGDFSFFAI